MRYIHRLFISWLVCTLLLAGCSAQNSDEWHVGYCTAGIMSDMPNILSQAQIEQSITLSAKANGLNATQVLQGYNDFKKGEDYTNSCKIARKLEQTMK